jgi:hypothetical protein
MTEDIGILHQRLAINRVEERQQEATENGIKSDPYL